MGASNSEGLMHISPAGSPADCAKGELVQTAVANIKKKSPSEIEGLFPECHLVKQ